MLKWSHAIWSFSAFERKHFPPSLHLKTKEAHESKLSLNQEKIMVGWKIPILIPIIWTLSETPLQTNLVIASLVSTASYNRISWMLKLAAKEIHIQFSLNERFLDKTNWWWWWWGAWWPSSSPSLARGGVWEWDGGHKKRLAVRATYPTTYHESLWSDRPLKKNAKRNKLISVRQASSSHNQSSLGSLWKKNAQNI